MSVGVLVVTLENTKQGAEILYDLLVRLDGVYTPSISSRTDLSEYALKLLKNGTVFCALNGDGNYIGLVAFYANDFARKRAFISTIGVIPKYHGTGLSSVLLLKAIDVSIRNKMNIISLEVDTHNQRAIRFYKKHGFHEEGRLGESIYMAKSLIEPQSPARPFVSICCATYNHAPFITKTIDGFLKQRTSFPIEILIHDDASNDGTSEILREYEEKYPDQFFPIYQKENQYSKGIKISSTYQFPRARGKYIAMCEGDDYWTDPLKLQKQVDFLEANPDHILCFHKVKALVGEEYKEEDILEGRFQQVADKERITDLDLLKYGNFIHTCSVVFRNIDIKLPFEFVYSPVGDYFYFLLLAEKGLLYRLDEYMGVYRRGSGIYSTLPHLDMQRKNVLLHLAVLSYLSREDRKKIYIGNVLKAFSDFENILINQTYQKEKIANYASLKGLVGAIIIKTFRLIRKTLLNLIFVHRYEER